jgi:thioredoxin reductase (NADPH)
MIKLDVLVLGGGPAGLSAAGQLVRAGLRTMVFERGRPGGLLWNAGWVENYPGFPGGISGPELASLFRDQALNRGVMIEARSIRRLRPSGNGYFMAEADRTSVRAEAAIVASGTRPIFARLPGCAAILGRRAFTEIADFEPDKIKGRRALIIGGGDASFDYALHWLGKGGMAEILIRSKPKSLALLVERARAGGIPIFFGASPVQVTKTLKGIRLYFVQDKSIRRPRFSCSPSAAGRTCPESRFPPGGCCE